MKKLLIIFSIIFFTISFSQAELLNTRISPNDLQRNDINQRVNILNTSPIKEAIDLKADIENNEKIKFIWTKSKSYDFAYYKLVFSDNNELPAYPEDELIFAGSNIDENYFKTDFRKGFYRLCTVENKYYEIGDKNLINCSNTAEIIEEIEYVEEINSNNINIYEENKGLIEDIENRINKTNQIESLILIQKEIDGLYKEENIIIDDNTHKDLEELSKKISYKVNIIKKIETIDKLIKNYNSENISNINSIEELEKIEDNLKTIKESQYYADLITEYQKEQIEIISKLIGYRINKLINTEENKKEFAVEIVNKYESAFELLNDYPEGFKILGLPDEKISKENLINLIGELENDDIINIQQNIELIEKFSKIKSPELNIETIDNMSKEEGSEAIKNLEQDSYIVLDFIAKLEVDKYEIDFDGNLYNFASNLEEEIGFAIEDINGEFGNDEQTTEDKNQHNSADEVGEKTDIKNNIENTVSQTVKTQAKNIINLIQDNKTLSFIMIFIIIFIIATVFIVEGIKNNLFKKKINISKEINQINQKCLRYKTKAQFETSLKQLQEKIESNGYEVSPIFLVNFIVTIKNRFITILLGKNGIGKTSFVENYIKGLYGDNYENYFKKVLIKEDIDEERKFVGLYDRLNNNYVDPYGITKLITKAYFDKNNQYFILLDEMNIQNIENYFPSILETDKIKEEGNSSFIKVGEINNSDDTELKKKKIETIKQYNFIIEKSDGNYAFGYKIPSNISIIGTANIDQNVEPFSGKIIDRSDVIKMEFMGDKDYTKEKQKISKIKISPKKEFNKNYTSSADEQLVKKIKEIITISKRLESSTLEHISLYNSYFPSLKCNIILQKILPKVFGNENKEILEKLLKICDDSGSTYLREKTKKEIEKLLSKEFINFWEIT